jgi:hypothetical protein
MIQHGTKKTKPRGTGADQIYHLRLAEFRQTPEKIISTRLESCFSIYQLHFSYSRYSGSQTKSTKDYHLLTSRDVTCFDLPPAAKSVRKIASFPKSLACRVQRGREAEGMEAAFFCRPLNTTALTCANSILLSHASRLHPAGRRSKLIPAPARRASVCAGPLRTARSRDMAQRDSKFSKSNSEFRDPTLEMFTQPATDPLTIIIICTGIGRWLTEKRFGSRNSEFDLETLPGVVVLE